MIRGGQMSSEYTVGVLHLHWLGTVSTVERWISPNRLNVWINLTARDHKLYLNTICKMFLSCPPIIDNVLASLLSNLPCGQDPQAVSQLLISGNWNAVITCFLCVTEYFSPAKQNMKSVHIFKTTKTKTRAVSLLFSSELSLFSVNELMLKMWVWVCACVCLGRWVCTGSLCTCLWSVISLCKCYAKYKRKEKHFNFFCLLEE